MRSWPASAVDEATRSGGEGAARGPAVGAVRILGLDPGLRTTGWGVIDTCGNRLTFVAHGTVAPDPKLSLAERLRVLFVGVQELVTLYRPTECAIEETFVNQNPVSTLKLGHARAAVMLAPATIGLPLAEYKPNLIKKSVVGGGHADKTQVMAMMRVLLPGCTSESADAADALAVAVCHAHHRATARRVAVGAR